MKRSFLFFVFITPFVVLSQQLDSLTIEQIMSNPSWIGTSPSNVFWSTDSQSIYFNWNPDKAEEESLYLISLEDHVPRKVDADKAKMIRDENRNGVWNHDHSQYLFISGSTLYLRDIEKGILRTLVQTTDSISNPQFLIHQTIVSFQKGDNLYTFDLSKGSLKQLTNFKKGFNLPKSDTTEQNQFLKADALQNSTVLTKREEHHKMNKETRLKTIYLEGEKLIDLSLSPDKKYVVFQLAKEEGFKNTHIPNYISVSGYTENLDARPKVGEISMEYNTFILNLETNEIREVYTHNIQGIRDIPEFYKDYPAIYDTLYKDPPLRKVKLSRPVWNPSGNRCFVVVNSLDHKDRWIMDLDLKSGELDLLDRQHDDAWIGGPGISDFNWGFNDDLGNIGWLDEEKIWFHSEASGYSHLYSVHLNTKRERALTQGKFEVQNARLSLDRKTFFITTNQIAPGTLNFYQLNIDNKELSRVTKGEGGNRAIVSPDDQYLAILQSTAIHPWELFLQKNSPTAKAIQLTDKAETTTFKSYSWRDPAIFTFLNRDGDSVYANVYKPKQQATTRPGLVFVHGYGYLQDVKNYWSDNRIKQS